MTLQNVSSTMDALIAGYSFSWCDSVIMTNWESVAEPLGETLP